MSNNEKSGSNDQDAFIANLDGKLSVFYQTLANLIVLGADKTVILETAETAARRMKENSNVEGPGAALSHAHGVAGAEQAVQEIRELVSKL
jgi:hypothetical protein